LATNGHKVLLIEDNLGDVRLIRETFAGVTRWPFEIEDAGTLAEGLECLAKRTVDVVLLDLSLPDAQGLEGVTLTRAAAPEVAIVVLTGLDDEGVALDAVRQGAQDYLTKDQIQDPGLLLRSMRYAIERQRLIAEVDQARRQRERELVQAGRNHQHFLAMTEGPTASGNQGSSPFDEELLNQLTGDYREIILRYVLAVRIREDRPSDDVRELAKRLIALRAKAKDIVRLHLSVVNPISERALPDEDRAFANDARLVLVELMGSLMDGYEVASGST